MRRIIFSDPKFILISAEKTHMTGSQFEKQQIPALYSSQYYITVNWSKVKGED